MGHSRRYSNRLSQVLSPQGKLFPDANPLCRRAYDDVLPLRKMWQSMEGKLTSLSHDSSTFIYSHRRSRNFYLIFVLAIFLLLLSCPTIALADIQELQQDDHGDAQVPFVIVIFMCVWKRPLVTHFVLQHFASLNMTLLATGVSLELFVVGSDRDATHSLASAVGAAYAIHPNNPVGRKHQFGMQSLRAHFVEQVRGKKRPKLPDAVAVFGSDDVVPARYFTLVHQYFRPVINQGLHTRSYHVLGLRDVWFHDLRSQRLAYTPGYSSFSTPLAGTVGCGRAFSWAFLDSVQWKLWDLDRDRGLDQSVVRNLFRANIFMPEVTVAIMGRDFGVYAVDIKTDAFHKTGTNVWSFETVMSAVGRSGRLLPFSEEIANVSLRTAFGTDFVAQLDKLRNDMERAEVD